MLNNIKRPNVRTSTSQSAPQNNTTSDIANSLQTLEQTCRAIQQQCETKKLAAAQDMEHRMAIIVQENIQNTDIVRSAIGHNIITPCYDGLKIASLSCNIKANQ